MNQIELEYQKVLEWHNKRKEAKSDRTGVQAVAQYLLDNKQKIWWFAWELIGKTNSKGEWLSHRSPARASDLAIHFPKIVEARKVGRFCVYRLKRENLKEVNEFLK